MKKILAVALSLLTILVAAAGCAPTTPAPAPAASEAVSSAPVVETAKAPKYVFLFIGDGMSYVQVNAAQVLNGNNTSGEVATKSLNFTQFPVAGVATTYDSTSFCRGTHGRVSRSRQVSTLHDAQFF